MLIVPSFSIYKYFEIRHSQQQEIEFLKDKRDHRRRMLYMCNHVYTPDKQKQCEGWRNE